MSKRISVAVSSANADGKCELDDQDNLDSSIAAQEITYCGGYPKNGNLEDTHHDVHIEKIINNQGGVGLFK